MEVTADGWVRGGGWGGGGGFSITHMLRSIIPSFVKWTMSARVTGLKKDTLTVTASNPGETPTNQPRGIRNKL